MEEISTKNKLILLAYGELNAADAAALHQAISGSAELQQLWDDIQFTLSALDDMAEMPALFETVTW
ncbi:MAG: hypothetical protein U0T84_01915 [Chitinophagales bacterium]